MLSGPTKKLRVKASSGGDFYAVSSKRRFRGRHLFAILLILGVSVGIYEKVHRPGAKMSQQRQALEAGVLEPIAAQPRTAAAVPASQSSDPFEIRHLDLHAGDTLEGFARDYAIPGAYSRDWRKACPSGLPDRFNEKDEIILVLNRADGFPVELVYLKSRGGSYTLRKSSVGWECRSDESMAAGSGKTVRGVWSENFYDSCIAAGLPAKLVSNLADIFSYDVDLTSELREGDSFSVFYQEYPIQSSEGTQFLVLGAEISVSGKVFEAFGFSLPDGSWDYFDAKGASLKRAFLKSPIDYRHSLSSKTSSNIKPVSRNFRSTSGLSFVAPKGTMVCAIGDGFVSAIRKNGRKNVSIEIRHRGGYSSSYGNLGSFSRGLRRGSPVSRAETIGSAGPVGSGKCRLDFHLYKDGKPVNFQSAEFARSKYVPKDIVPEFEKSKDFCQSALHGATAENK